MPGLPLTQRTLRLHADRVSVPTYDRGALQRGVVHIGVGSFHRSHQAVYFDALARLGLGDGWAITGVGLHRRAMKDVLTAQDGLYTVVARGAQRDDARVVGVITRYLFAPEDNDAVIEAVADETTRLVTLTLTAAGYEPDGEAVELLVSALDRRRRLGRGPFTVLSCDNMPSNGRIAAKAVVTAAGLRDPALGAWISRHVTFPSSMVDRITPKTTPEDLQMVKDEFGVRDRWPVMTEPFSQWVVEDAFCNGRPPLDAVGVQFVDDVRPYALMKTRMLNAGHSALGYLGRLAGHELVDEAMAQPELAAYVDRLMTEEIAPLLPPVDVDLEDYAATLRERMANPAVADRLSRLCRNGSLKVPAHILSSIADARAAGRPHALLTLAVSAWCRYLRDADEIDDPNARRLQELASDPRALLADHATFGALGRCPRFVRAVERDLREFDDDGVHAAVARHVGPGVLAA